MRDRRLAAARTAGTLALTALLAACGIRSTTVPVDAGPAPSRVSCAAPDSTAAPGTDTVPRSVYLVCHDQIAAVKRSVPVKTSTPELLSQLQRGPLPAETKAGFYTAVPGVLSLARSLKADPPGSLRLTQPLDELPSFALAQIVCTLTDPDQAAPGHTLLLGGPTPASPIRAYTCTSDLRTRPDAADGTGQPVG